MGKRNTAGDSEDLEDQVVENVLSPDESVTTSCEIGGELDELPAR